jgi:H+/Na+-translocating ferredoxin:NAD+ oxidoreductase subunit G
MLSINAFLSTLIFIGMLGLSEGPSAPSKLEEAIPAYFGSGATLEYIVLELSKDELTAAKKDCGRLSNAKDVEVWSISKAGKREGYAFVNNAKGKVRKMSYAVLFDIGGVIQGIEILKYRESHGGEVAHAIWRDQFKGKTSTDKLKVGKDIRNITGATISSRSVTGGVKATTKLFIYLQKLGKLDGT